MARGESLGQVIVEESRSALDSYDRVVFTSAILPPYLRKSRSIEESVPWLYRKGVSTGDYPEAPESLIGRKTVEEVPLTGLSLIWNRGW